MRKLKLLLAAFALFGVSAAYADVAWTNKTSVITNPSFETDEAISNLTSCGWATDRVTGWTIAPNSPGNSQVGVGNSSSTIQGIASTFSPSAGDKYFYMRENWNPNTTFSISQTIPDGNIPAGIYRLTVKTAMFSSVASTYTLSLQEEGQKAATNSFSYAGTANSENWRDWSVMLVKRADDTDLTITAAYKTPSENSGSKHYALLLDDVKLEYLTGVTSENTFDMTSWIVNPSFELNTFNGTQADGSTSAGGGQRKKPTGYTCFFNVSGWEDCAASTTNPADGSYCMNAWFGSVTEMKFYQTIEYLPEGVYEISAKARTNESTTGIYTYGIVNGGSPVVSASWDESKIVGEWNSMESWQTLTARVSIIGGGSLQFGLRSDKFVQFDDFHLTYLGSDLLLSEANAAWDAAHGALAALDATDLPDAAEAVITEELAKSRPETLTPLEAATAALQALIDSYDGIKAAFDEYKDLKAQVADLKNTSKYTFTGDAAVTTLTSALSTIDASAEAATDAATLTALLPSLKTAGNTFVTGIESNDGFDLTYNIENNSFETGNLTSWTCSGGGDTGVKSNSGGYATTGTDGDYLFNTWNGGSGSEVSQTLSSLPAGYYTVTALVASDAGNAINILAGATIKIVNADGTNGKDQFVEGTTDKTLVSDGSLEIGTNSAKWYKSDYFRLTYYTVKAGAAEAWAAAKTAAESARDDAAYTNVTGSEKTNLLAEIAKAEPSTAEAYGTATTALQEKTSAFIAAKDNYDALVAMRTTGSTYTTVAWPRASTAKATALADAIAAAPTDATDAVTKTNAIVTAYRQFVESNGLAEGVAVAIDKTSELLVYDADVSTSGWTTGSIGTNNGEKYTKGDGTQPGKFFDGGWSASAGVDITLTQELTLPEGQYQLQITARGASNLDSYSMSIGGQSVNLPTDGSTGGTFGNGWSDKFLTFESTGSALTLTIAAASTEYQQWISFNRLRLVRLDATLADATDYSNLNSAIAAAEANLGFENGEYAPYNNTAAMAKLAEAKAIDQDANNVQEDVQALTIYLNNASNWTANVGEVDIIYNGTFAVANGTNPLGWTRSNGAWGQQITGLTAAANDVDAETTTAWYYNTNGAWEYGKDDVYKMPLAASQAYKLTFKYRSHESNSNNSLKASVLNDSDEGLSEVTFAKNGDATKFVTATAYFTTGAAGNYILSLTQSGNTHLTDVSIEKVASATLALNEASTYVPVDRTFYETVTLARPLATGKWNTFVVPFDIDNTTLKAQFGNDVAVSEATLAADAVTFTPMATPAITANKPVIIKGDRKDSYSFSNVLLKTGSATIAENGTSFVGNYTTNKTLENGWYYIASNELKVANGNQTIDGFRAYFTTSAGARLSMIIDGEETNAIEGLELNSQKANVIYNLNGQRVEKAKKGLYIVNGKKAIVK